MMIQQKTSNSFLLKIKNPDDPRESFLTLTFINKVTLELFMLVTSILRLRNWLILIGLVSMHLVSRADCVNVFRIMKENNAVESFKWLSGRISRVIVK